MEWVSAELPQLVEKRNQLGARGTHGHDFSVFTAMDRWAGLGDGPPATDPVLRDLSR